VPSAECEFEKLPFAFELTDTQPIIMKAGKVIEDIINALKRGEPIGKIAAQFHAAVADVTLRACMKIRERTGIN
jgi:hydrogenase maturation protein HypF